MKKKTLINPNILLLLTVVIWGSGFIAVEKAINSSWSVPMIMTFRFMIASIFLFLIFYKNIINIKKEEIKYGLLLGIFLFLAFFLQTLGQNYTNLSNVAFFTASNVVMIPFISWVLYKKKPTSKNFIFCFLSFLGMFFLSYKGGRLNLKLGDILTLLSALFFALQISFLEKITKDYDFVNINFMQIFTSFLFSLISLFFSTEIILTKMMYKGILPVIYLGIFSTCLCYILQTYSQKYVSAVNAGIILSLEGLFGALFSILLGIEIFSINIFIGGILLIISSIFSTISEGSA